MAVSMAGVLGSTAAQLALVVLRDMMGRKDVHDAEKLKIVEEINDLNVEAQTWKTIAMADPDRASSLGLRGTHPPGIRSIRLDDPPKDNPKTG